MPELPEAETIARQLERAFGGRSLTRVRAVNAAICERRRPWPRAGARLAEVHRRGKKVLLDFDDGSCLLVNLGMSGQLRRRDGAALPRHTHLVFSFAGGEDLIYVDARRLGRLDPRRDATTLFASRDDVAAWCDARLGFDALEITWEEFKDALGDRRKVFKQLFLDQRPIAGVGNIYADETLFRAGVHPRNRPADLNDAELKRVWRSMRAVLAAAVRACGTSFRDYVTADGAAGDFAKRLKVYGRQGERCRVCGGTIRRLRWPAGRSTHYCPRCQRLRRRKR